MSPLALQIMQALIFLTPVYFLVGGSYIAYVATGARLWWQTTAAAIVGYLLLASISGMYACTLVPADYTLLGRWTTHPAANPLGEIHAVDLQRADTPGMMAPEVAIATRERIQDERRRVLATWLWLTFYGAVAVLLAFLFWHRRRDNR